MANAKCRNCHNDAGAGAYCSSCAAAVRANALNPFFIGKWRKRPGRPGKLSRENQFSSFSQQHLFRQLALQAVTV